MAAIDKIHHGRNVKRFREMLGIKQDALAYELGDDWNQQKISLLEQKETIDRPLLELLSKVLKVPVEAIENFDDQAAINVISNSFTSNDNSTLNAVNPYCTFNPLEKYIEAMEDNKKLYERLLESEKEKVELLKSFLKK